MAFVDGLNFGVGETLRQIPCQTGRGAPTTATAGAAGCLYMDTDSDKLYLCNGGTPGAYSWIPAVDVEALDRQPVYLTQKEYDALEAAGQINPNTPYMIIRGDT